ncbi:MAG TPA: polysaccharide biosynthesis/export family protein [Candidatus Acidoferrum sp.]|nr:polysaccharide biosynthesis/export family protein [Candidatus Acidoferrum sp.]
MKTTTSVRTLSMALLLALAAAWSGGTTADAGAHAGNTPGNSSPAANKAATNSTAANAAAQDASSGVDHPVPAQRNPRYKICRDDVLSLSFPIAPEFNQKITVMPDGYVNLQGAGSVYVLGMTVPEAVETIKKAYTGVLHDPIIDVDLTDFQKPYFVVLGQVGKPGQYDLRYDMTITQAVAVAGGFAPTAKTQLLYYHPISNNMMEVKRLNIKEVLNGKNVNEEVHLSPGDMIFVPEKAITKFRKYVPYSFGAGVYPNTTF